MDAIAKDIEYLNSELLRRAIDPDSGERLLRSLEASPAVMQRIAVARSNGVGSAIRCGVSLAIFSRGFEANLLHTRETRACRSIEIGPALREVNLLTLHTAQYVASLDPTLLQLHFATNERVANALVCLGVEALVSLAQREASILTLRGAGSPLFWDRLLIGDRYMTPRGVRISHPAAKLNLASAGLRRVLARDAQVGRQP